MEIEAVVLPEKSLAFRRHPIRRHQRRRVRRAGIFRHRGITHVQDRALLDHRLRQRRAIALQHRGVVTAAGEHEHDELAAGQPLRLAAADQAADLAGKFFGKVEDVFASEKSRHRQLAESRGIRRRGDLPFPFRVEHVAELFRDVRAFDDVRIVFDADDRGGDGDVRAVGGDRIEARFFRRAAIDHRAPLHRLQRLLLQAFEQRLRVPHIEIGARRLTRRVLLRDPDHQRLHVRPRRELSLQGKAVFFVHAGEKFIEPLAAAERIL
jgi:hypothetical protein